MQHVRAAALGQRLPLLDAEAVLLVDDGDGEVGELDGLLDQRVRADGELRFTGGELRPGRSMLLRGQRAGEQDHADSELAARLLDGEEMLLGKRLGRRHQRALAPVLDGAQQRVERDDRLPGADVALQQPLHRHGTGEIRVELADRLLLPGGELEREQLAVARDQLAGRAERRGDRLLRLAAAARDSDLEQEQLVEREPPPTCFRLLAARRAVQRPERVEAIGQPLATSSAAGSGSYSACGSAPRTSSRSRLAFSSSLAG